MFSRPTGPEPAPAGPGATAIPQPHLPPGTAWRSVQLSPGPVTAACRCGSTRNAAWGSRDSRPTAATGPGTAGCLTSLGLGFPICQMGMIAVFPSEGTVARRKDNVCKSALGGLTARQTQEEESPSTAQSHVSHLASPLGLCGGQGVAGGAGKAPTGRVLECRPVLEPLWVSVPPPLQGVV